MYTALAGGVLACLDLALGCRDVRRPDAPRRELLDPARVVAGAGGSRGMVAARTACACVRRYGPCRPLGGAEPCRLRVVIIGLMMVSALALGLIGFQIANPTRLATTGGACCAADRDLPVAAHLVSPGTLARMDDFTLRTPRRRSGAIVPPAVPQAAAEISPATASAIQSAIGRMVLGATSVRAMPAGGRVVLMGTVPTAAASQQAEAIARGYVGDKAVVISELQVLSSIQVNVRVRDRGDRPDADAAAWGSTGR